MNWGGPFWSGAGKAYSLRSVSYTHLDVYKRQGYKSAKKSLLGYAVFSLWMVGTYIPMYFMVEDSWASFAASFGAEYADQVMAVMPMWSIILVIAGIFVFAIFGGLLGKALLKKHFAKAGIA